MVVVPFLDAKGDGSMPAWLSFGVGLAIVHRLWGPTPVGWPEAIMVFCAFVGVAIYEAAMTVARVNPERLLDMILARMGIGDVGNALGGADWQFTPKVPEDV
jgi:hypothetical protein